VPTTVVFLWISAATALGELSGVAAAPSERAALDLRDFGAARGLNFVPVSAGRPPGLAGYDPALVDALEADLEQARTALSALEEANAGARLSKVEAQLLAHPYLPQASFLMGECLALQAQAARATNGARASELETRRLALEGPRAVAFGETTAPSPALPSLPKVTVELRGLGETDELELDGVRLAPKMARVTIAPGLHHARVWRGGRPIFAAFSKITVEQKMLPLAVPPLVPCGAEDLELAARHVDATGAGARSELPADVSCEHWARVREANGGIAVALCERSHCAPFVLWRRQAATPFTPIAEARRGFPTWAGFALASAAALAASSILVWQSGAFDRGQPGAATWRYGGLNPQSLRF
jgi:hypothetical protein